MLIICFIYSTSYSTVNAQNIKNVESEEEVQNIGIDSTKIDSQAVSIDTIQSGGLLESEVKYNAVDTMILKVKEQKAYLYGNAVVKYETLELKADYIEIDFKNNLVYATGVPDSTGKLQGTPIFIEDGKEYLAQRMTYNFQTQKGKINTAFTQEGDGYIHGDHIKKADTNVFYIKGGKYTTCNLEHPHFYIHANKLKVINQNKIVTGPANLVVEDVQTPIAIPFGFFPNKNERQSGIIIPAYGESQELGFNLQNGGFYWAISDNADLKLVGDVYTNGSFAARAISNYKKKYKFSGNFNFNYTNTKNGDPETVDYSETESFFINWSHRQDAKARPNSSFSASVNAGSTNYFQTDFNTDLNQFLTNQFKSNITYSQKIPNTPFNFSLNGSHSQNSQDSTIFINLPQATFTMSRIFVLKDVSKSWKKGIHRDLFQNFGITATVDAKNQVTRKEAELFEEGTLDDLQNGIQTTIPVSTNFKLGYFTVSGSANYSGTSYFNSIRKEWDAEEQEIVTSDTINEFNTFFKQSYSAGVTTKIYGMYSFKRGKIKAIRHVMTPNVTLSLAPDQSLEALGYYRTVQSDTLGNTTQYSIFDNGIYGRPTAYRQQIYNLSLQNNIEMKYKVESDTGTTYKKIKLLEALNFATSYDVHKDSLNWNPISVTGRTNIGKFITLQLRSSLDTYAVDTLGNRINKSEFDETGNYFRIPTAGGSVGIQLKSKSSEGKEKEERKVRAVNNTNYQRQYEDIINNPNAYVDFNIPWSLNINYSIDYRKLYNQEDDYSLINTLNFTGDLNITDNWKIGFRSGYDIELQELTPTSLNIYRDLHCWQINFQVIPFGPRTSYTFDIGIKAPLLQDLKYNKRSNWFDNN